MDAVAVTVLVDCNGAGFREFISSQLSDSRIDATFDFNGIRRLVVEPTMEAIVAVRTNAVCRMDQLSHSCETI